MQVLITDDEPLARARLRSLIDEIDGIDVIGEACNGKESLLLSNQLKPDIVLLDIRMPGIDGLEAASHLCTYEKPPAVIFTTAYSDHALAAFESNAVDYLLKPIRKQRLEQALKKAHQLNRAQLHALSEDTGSRDVRTHICVQSRESMQLIPLADVIYFHADHKYVTVRHRTGEVLIEEPLKDLEQEFQDEFIRIHRSTLISASSLTGIEKAPDGGYQVLLRDIEDRLEISRRHVASLRKHLSQFSAS